MLYFASPDEYVLKALSNVVDHRFGYPKPGPQGLVMNYSGVIPHPNGLGEAFCYPVKEADVEAIQAAVAASGRAELEGLGEPGTLDDGWFEAPWPALFGGYNGAGP